jgi:hypothetical protein
VDNGAPETLASACSGVWNPKAVSGAEGYVLVGGPPPGVYELNLVGCVGSAAGSEGLDITLNGVMAAGTYTDITTAGTVRYTDSSGSGWGYAGDPFKIDFTALSAIGAPIQGTFNATVSHVMGGNAAHLLNGEFSLCRQPDEDAP